MKARVKTYLNERTQKPSVNAPNYRYFSPGDEIEIVDIVNGDPYNGNSTWYKLDNGAYVWSGGVEGINSIDFNEVSKESNADKLSENLINALQIKQKLTGNGKDIRILLADSGIELIHPALEHAVSRENSKSLIKDENNLSDLAGHGTQLSGVIASKFNDENNTVQGLAPDSTLLNYRVVNNDSITDNEALSELITHLKTNPELLGQLDVINMSFDFHRLLIDSFNDLLDLLSEKGIITVVADGDNYATTHFSKINRTIKIGVFDLDKNINLTKVPYDYFFFNHPIKTTDIKESYKKIKGDSLYAAVVSGIIANYLSTAKIKKENRFKEVIHFLDQISYAYTNSENNTYLKLYKG